MPLYKKNPLKKVTKMDFKLLVETFFRIFN